MAAIVARRRESRQGRLICGVLARGRQKRGKCERTVIMDVPEYSMSLVADLDIIEVVTCATFHGLSVGERAQSGGSLIWHRNGRCGQDKKRGDSQTYQEIMYAASIQSNQQPCRLGQPPHCPRCMLVQPIRGSSAVAVQPRHTPGCSSTATTAIVASSPTSLANEQPSNEQIQT